MRFTATHDSLELPMYGLSEAALYLRVPIKTLEYWTIGRGKTPPLVRAAGRRPRALSFMNLLECHMLAAMRSLYELKLPKIRRAVAHLSQHSRFPHPLIEEALYTNRVDVLIREIDLDNKQSRGGQLEAHHTMDEHLKRSEKDSKGKFKYCPG